MLSIRGFILNHNLSLRLSTVATLAMCTLALSLSACTNKVSPKKIKSRSNVTNDNGPVIDSDGALLVITQVVKSAKNPTSELDIIGDGQGSIGQYCTSTDGVSQEGAGPSTCRCKFEYKTSAGVEEVYESETTHREENMIRCSYSALPSNITNLTVKVYLTNSDSYSNELSFNFTTGGSSLNTADVTAFNSIKRYQCRDSLTIPYLFHTSIYDPIQSEDPRITYPLNFYSGNIAGAMKNYINLRADVQDGVGWVCPTTPNDPKEGFDISLYSVEDNGIPNGNKIYPVANPAFDRSTFYLARKPAGSFSFPVNAYIGPSTNSVSNCSDTDETCAPPVGYGVAPVPNNLGGEDCPSDKTNIPAGFKWVKVWLFRASLEDRKYLYSAKIQEGIESVACNPGVWYDGLAAGDRRTIFPDCADQGSDPRTNPGATPRPSPDTTNPAHLADRVFGLGVIQQKYSLVSCATPTLGSGTISSDFAAGSDIWRHKSNRYPDVSCTKLNVQDFLNLCVGTTTATNIGVAAPVPYDDTPIKQTIDKNISRYDYVFVVTPPDIHAKDFKNNDSKTFFYTPFRFYTKDDCKSGNPAAPMGPGDCSSSKMIKYGVKFHDVGNNGDGEVGDGRVVSFPVCAIQPTNGP